MTNNEQKPSQISTDKESNRKAIRKRVILNPKKEWEAITSLGSVENTQGFHFELTIETYNGKVYGVLTSSFPDGKVFEKFRMPIETTQAIGIKLISAYKRCKRFTKQPLKIELPESYDEI